MEQSLTLAFLLIAAGLGLLVAELFLPTGGIFFALAIAALVVGVYLTFSYADTSTGFLTLLGVFVAVPCVLGLGFTVLRHTGMSQRMVLQSPSDEDDTVASMPVNLELEQYRGRFGRAVTLLRPAGTVDFDGRRIDCLTEGMLVEAGTWVRCIDVKVGRVIVRAMDPPRLDDLENAIFPDPRKDRSS